MAQYIDKSALIAEIDRLIERAKAEIVLHPKTILAAKDYLLIEDYNKLLSFIDTLEVKEVDLEKETENWWKERLHLNPKNQLWMDAHQSIVFAQYFFELGLKTRKGGSE